MTQSFAELVEEFGLRQGPPTSILGKQSLEQAEKRLEAAAIAIDPYDPTRLLEDKAWWYIPIVWIGCGGYIVDKTSGDVNELGSSQSLDDCIWAHQRGIVSSGSDFIITSVTSSEAALTIVSSFARIADDGRRLRYRKSDAEKALTSIPAYFPRHWLWFAIRDLRRAVVRGEITFECRPSYLGKAT
jgi:hypothetical protein